MLPDGSLVPWKSPAGSRCGSRPPRRRSRGRDLVDSLMPNGGTLDYVADARYRGRTGVRKQSLENVLYSSACARLLRARRAPIRTPT